VRGDPAFQPDHALIAWRQRPDSDQDAAQVLDRLADGQLIEDLMGGGSPRSVDTSCYAACVTV
jgi:hypothetical protein